jgi:hypothetical protein
MVNLELAISLIGLFVILLGLLLIFRNDRLLDIPEGFENATPAGIEDLSNPIVKLVKKLGRLTTFFANPDVWITAYKHSKMSLADLARAQIEKDAQQSGQPEPTK